MYSLPSPTLRSARILLSGALALLLCAITAPTRAAVQVDPTFHFPADPALQGVYWCHLLPGGKILTGGYRAFRLNADGSLDASYPVLTTAESFIQKPVLEPNGGFTAFGSYYDEVLQRGMPFARRFTPNGLADSTFTPDLTAYSEVLLLVRDAAGRYLIAGRSSGTGTGSLRRLLANGAVDPTFQPLADFAVSAMTPIENGGWLLIGAATGESQLVRLRANGSVASQHDVEAGPVNSIPARSLISLENGNVIFGGEYPMLGVLRRDGRLARDFQAIYGEGPSDPSVSAILRLRDGRILAGAARTGDYLAHTAEWPLPEGEANWPAAPVFRSLPDGMIDLSFDFRPVQDFGVYDIALQPDGRFLTANGGTLRRFIETPSLPIFAFGDQVVEVQENGRHFVAITVYRAGNVQSRSAVTVATVAADSTAIPGRDYRPIHERLHFERGQWKRTVFVPLRDDRIPDGNKTISLRLSQPEPNSQLHSVKTTKIEIIDNESAPPSSVD
jgi:Calx-beta domain/Domain of unknown function (DUF5122) beta-propeller